MEFANTLKAGVKTANNVMIIANCQFKYQRFQGIHNINHKAALLTSYGN